MLQLIKEASGQNGVSARDDSLVIEVLNLVCPSTWRGACKTAVQLLFGQAGLVRPPPLLIAHLFAHADEAQTPKLNRRRLMALSVSLEVRRAVVI